MKPIFTRNPSTNFPPQLPIDLKPQNQSPHHPITTNFIPKRSRDRKSFPDKRSTENISLLKPLKKRVDGRVRSDLLGLVRSVEADVIVVDGDFVVGVVGDESELNGGVEEVGSGGEVEEVDVGFFDGELGLGRVEEEVDDED